MKNHMKKMKIICLLLGIFSLTAARVYPRTGINEGFNGVDGVMYDIPDYEDPEVTLFKLLARGVLPVYTIRESTKESKDLSNKNDAPHHQTEDIKKGLDTVISQLQDAKSKLESENNAIYFDIDKSVLSLESLKQHLYNVLHNATIERPLINNASAEFHPVNNASTEFSPVINAPTEQPFVNDEAELMMKQNKPATEYSSYGEEVKTDMRKDDIDITYAEPDKAAPGDKTLIRKKWTYKLSSIS